MSESRMAVWQTILYLYNIKYIVADVQPNNVRISYVLMYYVIFDHLKFQARFFLFLLMEQCLLDQNQFDKMQSLFYFILFYLIV